MKWCYSAALPAMLALPGALAAPWTPKDSSIAARTPGSFRAEIKHRLHEEGKLGKRSSGEDAVTYGGYWFAAATAGGQAVTVLIDTGSADL